MLNRYYHCQSGRLPQDLSDDVDGDYIRQNLNNLKSMFRRKTMTPEMKLKRKSLKMSARKKTKNSLKVRAKRRGRRGRCHVEGYTSAVVKSRQPTLRIKTSKIHQSKMSKSFLKSKKSQSRQCHSKSDGRTKSSQRNGRRESKMWDDEQWVENDSRLDEKSTLY